MEQKKSDSPSSDGFTNQGFVLNEAESNLPATNVDITDITPEDDSKNQEKKQQWDKDIEFLLSCISMSVGLGNIWRFPFTAYENGGGAFVIPYIIVLTLIGKPFYLFEMALGQFSSKSSIKLWSISPAFKGVGFAQFIALMGMSSYYCCLMAITLFFLLACFQTELPWAKCREEWGESCVDSETTNKQLNTTSVSSAELYFFKVVLREKDNIEDGIGLPDWRLTIGLLVSWLTVLIVVIRGVKGSGKAAYFTAIFPYIILIVLLGRAVTLEGSIDGILYFITPQWSKLWTAEVWYRAVGQCFFSLTVCFGVVTILSSHNKFNHNIYRDAMIVTTLDTFTSLLAGCTIFAILGHLSHELGVEDISKVVRGGTGLAFISYPETIAKFTWVPQLFGVLFFTMIFVLGVGSQVGQTSSLIDTLHDHCPGLKYWQVATGTCTILFLIGLIYVTPGGQFMVTLVDYFVTSFAVFLPATLEMIAVSWVYGLNNFLDDIEFMLKKRLSIFWTICWGILTPGLIIGIFIYTIVNLPRLEYNNVGYPDLAHISGWIVLFITIGQIPLWMLIVIVKYRKCSFHEMISKAFQSTSSWGPLNSDIKKEWLEFREQKQKARGETKNCCRCLLGWSKRTATSESLEKEKENEKVIGFEETRKTLLLMQIRQKRRNLI